VRLSVISAAVVAALVGYGSSVALVLAAAQAVGATAGQTASWVLALCLAKAAGSAILSAWARVPVVLAWSTPGAALVAASTDVTMAEAVGAFVLAGGLVAASGLVRPLGALVGRIPDAVAAAMLAGILLPFVLAAARVAPEAPALVLPMVALFLAVRLWNPAFAVLAALGLGVALAFGPAGAVFVPPEAGVPVLDAVAPAFRPEVALGLGLPLWLVTMAGQNLPGFAVLRAAGYTPPVRRALGVTGALSVATAPFGAHGVNMAAITAAICLGPDVHPDPARRWVVGLVYAAVWVGLGLAGPWVLAALAALPPPVLAMLVALGLLAPLTGALGGAFGPPERRFPAAVTLAVTASGVAAFGIGAAFWGLAAGLAVLALERVRPP
jgi:benzoate membrane transport protein